MTDTWWQSFYDDAFADVVMASGPDEQADRTAVFLVEKLALSAGAAVFDQCCGCGRLSIALARRGFRVIGMDLIGSYVDRAVSAAEAEGLRCEFHTADAFTFTPSTPCAGAFNWASSFGYTPDDGKNQEMLHRAFEALEPGGCYALDYYSAPRLFHTFQESVQIQYPGSNRVVTRRAHPDFRTGMIRQEWSFQGPGGEPHQRQSLTKMYMPHEIVRMLTGCGFTEIELFGGVDASPFTLQSPRCILVGRKP